MFTNWIFARIGRHMPSWAVTLFECPFYFWTLGKYRITPLMGRLVVKLIGKANVLKMITELFRIVAGEAEHPIKLFVLISDSEAKIKLIDLAHGRFLASDHLHQITIKGSEWFPLNHRALQSCSPIPVLDRKRMHAYCNYISKIIVQESSFPSPV